MKYDYQVIAVAATAQRCRDLADECLSEIASPSHTVMLVYVNATGWQQMLQGVMITSSDVVVLYDDDLPPEMDGIEDVIASRIRH